MGLGGACQIPGTSWTRLLALETGDQWLAIESILRMQWNYRYCAAYANSSLQSLFWDSQRGSQVTIFGSETVCFPLPVIVVVSITFFVWGDLRSFLGQQSFLLCTFFSLLTSPWHTSSGRQELHFASLWVVFHCEWNWQHFTRATGPFDSHWPHLVTEA